MLAELGVEPTLSRLHEAGVGLSIDEFKGRAPIVRPGLELRPQPSDFDNGLLRRHYEAATSGARSASRIAIDLDLLAHEAAYGSLFLEAFGLRERRFAAWRPVLPGLAGTKGMLRRAHLGLAADAWFSQYRHPLDAAGLRYGAMTGLTVAAARASGARIPWPRHVPLERAGVVAAWLADRMPGRLPRPARHELELGGPGLLSGRARGPRPGGHVLPGRRRARNPGPPRGDRAGRVLPTPPTTRWARSDGSGSPARTARATTRSISPPTSSR